MGAFVLANWEDAPLKALVGTDPEPLTETEVAAYLGATIINPA